MIKTLKMYNVEFGDCFQLLGTDIDENYSLLVDFGSDSPKVKVAQIESSIRRTLNTYHPNAKVCGMITHIHEDHYSLFCNLPMHFFDIFYLPNFFSPSIIRMSLFTLIFTARTSTVYAFAYALLKMIPNLLSSKILRYNSQIHFVQKGEKIIDDIDVLWPSPTLTTNSALDNIIENFEAIIRTRDEYTSIIETVNKLQRQYFSLLGENHRITQTDINMSTATEILSTLNTLPNLSLGLGKKETKTIRDIQNNCSIVISKPNSVLMLGDITAAICNKHIIPIVKNNQYKITKVSHHGTRPYFTKNLPASEYMLIPNGHRKRAIPISALYALTYRNSKFICSNACKFCEVRAAGITCNSIKHKRGKKNRCNIKKWQIDL